MNANRTRKSSTPFPFAQAVRNAVPSYPNWRVSDGEATFTYAFVPVGATIRAEIGCKVEAQFWVARQEDGTPRVSFEFFPASSRYPELNQVLASDFREYLRRKDPHRFTHFRESTGKTVLHATVNRADLEITESQLRNATNLLDFVRQWIGRWFGERIFAILDVVTQHHDVLDDLEECRSSHLDLSETEVLEIRKSRIGQGRFRAELILYWGSCCAVTGLTEISILRASHIKPWRNSSNQERLDPFNGLLLAPHLDALFDAGLITFDDSGVMIVSGRLSADDRLRLGVNAQMFLKKIEDGHRRNLSIHRQYHFQA